ncbi:hypothetical protein BN2475_440001 [Paraburkholderia ribeironis]|uniref:Uncharacterized protein n=1 Tax=Paraburkholderia ribeironis TaxID=1247936 RepID=A0A1N7S971_9BURK|nr:hypothetical protein BN2475_440001 [Paraburkholderia ribeironis]
MTCSARAACSLEAPDTASVKVVTRATVIVSLSWNRPLAGQAMRRYPRAQFEAAMSSLVSIAAAATRKALSRRWGKMSR